MKEYFVRDLKPNMEFIDFFIVKSIALRVGSNNKQYLDMHLGDATGDVSAKKWDVSVGEQPALSALKEGDIIKVKAQVSQWQGNIQLRVLKIRKSSQEDELVLKDFIKAAPESSPDMYSYIMQTAESISDEDFRAITIKLLEENQERLQYYPAAAKNHHAEYGGLLWHMKRMLMTGKAVCDIYTFLNRDLVLTGVIIHDMEKLNEIDAAENGIASGYSKKGQLLGHIVQGITSLETLGHEMGISEEKILLLQHMVLSHHYEPDFGSPKKPMFPEAEMLHYLDIVDARMYDMEEASANIEQGSFSERIRTLDGRKVYKPNLSD